MAMPKPQLTLAPDSPTEPDASPIAVRAGLMPVARRSETDASPIVVRAGLMPAAGRVTLAAEVGHSPIAASGWTPSWRRTLAAG
ncbi:hypothetical protein T492DRAFT_859314 [Pavlovales sp. CCMP2436]|nr:hypothetical protein T492DRAFT_859314 [Pavlovales sp. CCMP2436]